MKCAVVEVSPARCSPWRLGNRATTGSYEYALRVHGKPEVFTSAQGSQFTSDLFTGVLNREGITISMDGRGRAFDLYFCRAPVAQRQA